MRVTTRMMVSNMSRQLARQRESLNYLSNITSSGKQINRPSDDPAVAGNILADRAEISKYDQYQSNISLAQTWIEAGLGVLETVYDLLAEAKGMVVDQAAGDLDTRETITSTLESYYDQVVDLANTRFSGEYMYSGDADDARPFANITTINGGTADDLLFDLAGDAANVEIQIMDSSGAVVRTLTLTAGLAGTNTVVWDGLDNGGSVPPDGEYTYTVTAADAAGDPVGNYHTYRGSDGDKQTMTGDAQTVSLNQDGGEIFSEVLRALGQVLAGLKTDPYDPDDLDASIDDLAAVMEGLQFEIVALSVTNASLDTNQERLAQALLFMENKLGAEENCDADQAVLELQSVETAYQVTLEVAAMILEMPNLMEFM